MGMIGLQREGYVSLRLIFGTKQGRLKYLANQEILRRLGIEPEKYKSSEKHGQTASYITQSEFEAVAAEIATDRNFSQLPPDMISSESGYFYLIQLEPDHDPGRFKVGFTANVEERLRAHRCAAPLLKLRKIWPCRSLWEKTAID